MSMHATSGPDVRQGWEAVADGFDRFVTPQSMAFGERIVTRLRVGTGLHVLDVAAGTGALSIPAARMGATVMAVDISPRMVDLLRARGFAAGLPSLQARVADGQLLPFDDATFDLSMSMNGVSVFPDIPAGLREMVRVTRPGGRVAIVTFGPLPKVEFVALFLNALRAAAPAAVPSPTGTPLPPFRLADHSVLHGALEDVGLSDVAVETLTWTLPFATVDDYLHTVLASNPIAGQLTADLSRVQFQQLRQMAERLMQQRSGVGHDAGLHVEMHLGHGTAQH